MSRATTSLETDAVRIELIRRGWSAADIAQRAGMETRSFETQLSCNFPNLLARHKVEAAFDYSVPIWSDAKTLDARKYCRDTFGADPALLKLSTLRELAARVRLPGWQAHKGKAALFTAVIAHLAAIKRHRAKPPATINPSNNT